MRGNPSSKKPCSAIRRLDPLFDDRRDNFVGHQLAGIHHRLGLQSNRRSRPDRRAQHVAGRKLRNVVAFNDMSGLGALSGAGRPEKDDNHLRPSAELRFLDQAFILLRDKMALNLADRIERHRNNDEQ